MRVRNLALACVAALATTLPARADIILGYAISSFVPAIPGNTVPPASTIPLSSAVGTVVGGPGQPGSSPALRLNWNAGETKYIQVTIEGNANAPFLPAQSTWDGGTLTGMIASALIFNYPAAIVTNPYNAPSGMNINANRSNAGSQSPLGVGHPLSFTGPPGYNMGQTAITGADTGDGVFANMGILPPTVLFTFKVVAGTTGGIGVITLTDINPLVGNMGTTAGDFDPIVFAASHAAFPLFINVTAVPEPSSMALAGLAFAGIGWRKLRRKTTKVAEAV